MNRAQRAVVVLLVLAILMSTISVITSVSVLKFDFPAKNQVIRQTENTGAGQVVLYVEKAPQIAGAG